MDYSTASFSVKDIFSTPESIGQNTTVQNSSITVNEDGLYLCYFNCYFFNDSDARTNVGVSWEINGSLQDEVSASDYIRNAGDHDQASTSMMTVYSLSAGDQLSLRFAELGSEGLVELIGSKSVAYVRNIT